MHVLKVDYRSDRAPALFCQSLKETGFAVLSHHPISVQLVQKGYEEWRDFFQSEIKYQYQYQKPTQDGYFPFGTEGAADTILFSDVKSELG